MGSVVHAEAAECLRQLRHIEHWLIRFSSSEILPNAYPLNWFKFFFFFFELLIYNVLYAKFIISDDDNLV